MLAFLILLKGEMDATLNAGGTRKFSNTVFLWFLKLKARSLADNVGWNVLREVFPSPLSKTEMEVSEPVL